MGEFRKVMSGVVWFLFGTSFATIFSYLSKIFLARILGPSEFGLFTLSVTMMYFLSLFADLGIGEGLAYLLPKINKDKKKVNITITTTISFFATILLGIIIFANIFKVQISVFFGETQLVNFMPLITIFLALYTLPNIATGIARGFGDPKLSAFKEMIRGFLFLLIAPLATLFYTNAMTPLIAYITLYAIIAIFAFVYVKKFFKFGKINFEFLIPLFSFSIPFFASAILLKIVQWIDILMISKFLEASNIGIYSSAITVAFSIQFVMGAFSVMFLPVISKLLSNNKFEEAKKIYVQSCNWIMFIVAPVFVLMILFPKPLINILFGKEYFSATILLIPLGIAAFVNTILGPNMQLLLSWGKKFETIIILLIAAISNVVLNYILIPMIGVYGAAISSLIGVSIWNLGISLLIYKNLKVHPINGTYMMLFLTAILSGGIIFVIRSLLIIGTVKILPAIGLGSLFGILYLGFVYFFYPDKKRMINLLKNEIKNISNKIKTVPVLKK